MCSTPTTRSVRSWTGSAPRSSRATTRTTPPTPTGSATAGTGPVIWATSTRDGFIYFAGRRGDWIRVDSENISALAIERVLRRHPDVIAAGVYAVPDPRSGDQVMAAIEVADPAAFDAEQFARYLREQDDLGAKGTPRFLRVSGGLPVTGSNKVLKRELQAQTWHTDESVYRWVGRGHARIHRDDRRCQACAGRRVRPARTAAVSLAK